MRPADFVDDWPTVMLRSKYAVSVMEVIPLCDQRVSHLSWKRLTDADFYIPKVKDCLHLFTDFIAHLREHAPSWSHQFYDDVVVAHRRCGWRMSFPECLWFRLPDDKQIPKTAARNGHEPLRAYALDLAGKLSTEAGARLRRAADQPQEGALFVPAIAVTLSELVESKAVPQMDELLAVEVLAALRHAYEDAGLPANF